MMQQNRDRDIDLNQFYGILARLECKHGGSLKLSECSGQMPWPKRGIYFFFERGEQRRATGQGQRVVRVRNPRPEVWLSLHALGRLSPNPPKEGVGAVS